MFFSKFFLPLIAFAGTASVAFASPVAAPQPAALEARDANHDLEARQINNVLNIVQGLQSSTVPIVTNIQNVGTSGGDPTPHVNDLVSTLGGATSAIGGYHGPAPSPSDCTAIITIIISITLNIFTCFNTFAIVGTLVTLVTNALFALIQVLILLVPGLLLSLLTALLSCGLPLGLIGLLLSLVLGLLGL